MHEGPELTVALLLCLALAAGAAVRLLSQRSRVPFTVAMLLLGLGVGIAVERLGGEGPGNILVEVLRSGAHISPHTIILIFLPALIFESAYGLDVHAFGNDAGAVVLLAIPALVITTVLTAAAMMWLTGLMGFNWSWPAALTFGALISATDPVAVVAVLREVGAPRRLSVLIEGESLLNDGTAIVLYTVLVGLLVGGPSASLEIGPVVGRFVWVVAGGLGVGLLLAILSSSWIARTFNDPMVEITLTVVLAYTAMILGEGILHVSGVIAVVAAGLWMSGPGRTHISPEVSHFLHRFWEMLAYVANTLIFFLVGLVIAMQVDRANLAGVLVVLAIYLSITVIRFAVTFAFRPLMGLVADTISTTEASVMAWGGLRGAVSLALALAVSRHPDVPSPVGTQILIVTAGVVLLTILVNGSSTGWLLNRLGFTQVGPSERLANLAAESAALEEVTRGIERAARTRDLRTIPWDQVKQDLAQRRADIREQIDQLKGSLTEASDAERVVGYWRQALTIERRAYWKAFARGTLGGAATQILNREIELHLDLLAAGDDTPRPARADSVEGLTARMSRWARGLGFDLAGLQFSRLTLLYDIYRAEAEAAEKVLREVGQGAPEDEQIRDTYRKYLRSARERLEDLRTNLPEVTRAIETRLSRRIALNLERDALRERKEQGLLSERAAGAAMAAVVERMKVLKRGRPCVPLPETADVCRTSELFAGLDAHASDEMARITKEKVLAPAELLFEEGATGNSMYIVARGAVHVIREIEGHDVLVDILGSGDLFGEMSLLTGAPRAATIVAATTVTLGEIGRSDFDHVMDSQPHIRDQVWRAFEQRLLDNHLRSLDRFRHLSHDDRIRWAKRGRSEHLAPGARCDVEEGVQWVFVVTGTVRVGGHSLAAPALAQLAENTDVLCHGGSRVLWLPAQVS